MRHSKIYMIFVLLLAGTLVGKFYNWKRPYTEIEEFRGATLESADWNPLISKSVNNKKLTAAIDNHVFTNETDGIYMDDNLNVMIPVSIIRDSYNCSVHLYDEKELLIEKYNSSLKFETGSLFASFDNEEVGILSPMTKVDGEYYVPMEFVSRELGYSFQWDMQENGAAAANTSGETNILPASYDLRERGRAATVKNQGARGTCWAFAALSALETSLLPQEELEFSPDHMSLRNSFASNGENGGQYTMSMAYLTSWTGPVLEEEDPYDGVAVDNLTAVKHIQEAQVIESKNLEKIKEAVFKYGGVQSAIYSTLRNAGSVSSFYNKSTNAYCYVGQEKPNHDVVIIGWDDHYSKENFSVALEGDGAFICQNSWGKSFGEDGVFYVSYYDTNIGVHNVVYTDIQDVDNYDEIYQADLCGWVGHLGYNRASAYGANVYRARGDETVQAAGFYATGKNTEYEIYVVPQFQGEESLMEGIKAAQGKVENAGFYTIDFEEPIEIKRGYKFAVVLKITTPDSVHPLAIEYAADDLTGNVDLTDGEGYISLQGTKWESVEETQEANLCIKVYTNER